jgi:hypothetical protein
LRRTEIRDGDKAARSQVEAGHGRVQRGQADRRGALLGA